MEQMKITFDDALQKLRQGNLRFCQTGYVKKSTKSQRKKLVQNGQHPFACVVTCSDSRVIPECIFSTSLGEIFTIRTAGNVVGSSELASIEYAVAHLNTPLVVVMGHTHCGAVEAACEGFAEGNIATVISKIRNAVSDFTDLRKCEWENARHGVRELRADTSFERKIADGQLKIIAAVYDTESGEVTFDD